MKRIFHQRMKSLSYTTTLLFFITFNSIYAQCPTVPVSNQVICDAAGFDFNELSQFATPGTNGSIRWYLAPTGGDPLVGTQLVREGTYYAGDTTGNCGTRSPITIDFTVNDSNQNLDAIFCFNDNPTIQSFIDEALAVNIPSGGSVEIYSDFGLTMLVGTDMELTENSNFFIVFTDAGGCRSQIETGSTAVFPSPMDPNPDLQQQFCSDINPTIADLNPGTTDNFNWFDSIDEFNEPIPPALNGSTPLINGATYYVQADNFFCVSEEIAVVVQIDAAANAGMNNNQEYCEDNIPLADFDLFPLLGPDADNDGNWTGTLETNNEDRGTINLSGQEVGVYTFDYTVTGTGLCSDTTATITIEILDVLSSGTVSNESPVSFCISQLPVSYDLSLLLDNEDAGGSWFQGLTSADPMVDSPIDLSVYAAGTYDFTYIQNLGTNPCPEESTTVQVIVFEDASAGNAVAAQFCENDLITNSPYDLFDALDNSRDNDLGVWTDAMNNTITNPIDITGFTVTESPYSYTYTVDNGTCTDSETIVLDILPAPESGAYVGTPFIICEDQAVASPLYDLFNLLDGTQDANGSWFMGATSSGDALTNPIDISTLGLGTFDFTYAVPAIGTCTDDDVTVTVIINSLPNAGIPAPFIVCENDLEANSSLDLFDQLTGQDADGTWSDDDGTEVLTGSTVDLTNLEVGSYNFSYTLTDDNGCVNSSTVLVTVQTAPESGAYVGTPFTICEDQAIASPLYDLFNLLDGTQDTNGSWFMGATSSGDALTNPIDLTTLGTGTFDFTYAVPAIGTCTDDDVTVTVIIDAVTDAGVATDVIFCENELTENSPLDLLNQLTGEDAGGTWSDDNVTGVLTGNDVDITNLAVGSYNFTYTVNNGACADSETVLVTISTAPNAGEATNFNVCLSDVINDQTLDLFNQLTGQDSGGSWSDDDSTSQLSGSIVTIAALEVGTYNFTYSVSNSPNCSEDMETVQVTINNIGAPTVIAIQEFCDAATIDSLEVNGTGIQWYEDASLSTPLSATDALINGEDYFATQTDEITNCESSESAVVTVNIFDSPNSGIESPLVVCSDQNMIDLFTSLDGTQDPNGTWIDTDSTNAITDNIFDATAVPSGDYSFEYFVTASAPCTDASTIVTVTVESPVLAGMSTSLEICSDNGTTDLFTLLGTATAGGTWSPSLTSSTGVFDPLLDAEGTYTYSVTSACNTATASVLVEVTSAPDAGMDNEVSLCISNGTEDLLSLLGGTPDATGTWSPLLNSGTNIFDPSIDPSGTYTYTVTATTPCAVDAISTLIIQVENSLPPTLVTTSLEFCATDAPIVMDLDSSVTGEMIRWYDAIDATEELNDTNMLIDATTYYATQTSTNGCESSVRTAVTVQVSDAPTPTIALDGNLFCINDNPSLQQLTLNINEFDATSNSLVWYSSIDGLNVLPLSTILTDGTVYYAALIDMLTGCESSLRLPVTVDLTACDTVDIPDGFSPNGDGTNDVFDVDNLGFLYPNYNLEFYNRYGNKVYEGTASTPPFNGFSNTSNLLNDGELPVGVYYYILKFNDGVTKPLQGRIYLSR
ncbi:gliding motility-associated C-terminal domain-containing protein [uncultured Nonlabens sp.]|uniref:gliding motility-associated C-terminal domain-containing protein n=1 Tax=uncultured Nonlabens sp. TaxID=859306 RepID=UPI002610C2D3|nr:gliding motility-associated C-terminal domain-containing protein [uncultured Nonlabens sp.]